MGEIRALCISEKRGTQKHALDRVFFMTEHGIDGDAHAGDWHRQVSLLGRGEIDGFRAGRAGVPAGGWSASLARTSHYAATAASAASATASSCAASRY